MNRRNLKKTKKMGNKEEGCKHRTIERMDKDQCCMFPREGDGGKTKESENVEEIIYLQSKLWLLCSRLESGESPS